MAGGRMSRTYSLTLSRDRVPGLTQADAVDIAAETARVDEFRVLGIRDVLPTASGYQVILDVEPLGDAEDAA